MTKGATLYYPADLPTGSAQYPVIIWGNGTGATPAVYGKIDETKIGAAGHSQGGGGAIAAGADPLIDTAVPIQPGPQGVVTHLSGSSLFIAGQYDWIVPSFFVRSRYEQAGHVPAIFAELRGADHFLPGDTRYRLLGVVTAWFRFWLAGDQEARSIFFGLTCLLCNDTGNWSAVARNSKAQQLPRLVAASSRS